MGISNGLKNTNDENFVSHNSNKPFIRTMEDDLKKIKNGPIGSKSKAKATVPRGEASRPVSDSVLPQASAPVSVSPPDTAPVALPVIPENLPVDIPFVEKDKQKREEDEKAEQSRIENEKVEQFRIENEKIKQANKEREKAERLRADKEKEKIVQVSRPIAPVLDDDFSLRPQNTGKLLKETETLSPEARLARQVSLGAGDSEYKESLIIPPSSATSLVIPKQFDKTARPFNFAPSTSSSLDSKKKSIEEIIKEDSPSSYLKKFIKVFFTILFIFGITFGSYYFYIKKESFVNQSYTEAFISDIAEVIIETDLNTDLSNEVRQSFSSTTHSGMYRLIIKDKNGQNNLELENFGNSLNIVLPDFIISVLEKDYNLIVFNYPEKNYLRLGLVFKVKNSSDISDSVKSWEADMYRNLETIFMEDAGVYDAEKQFGDNMRNNFNIRYLSLGSENVGLNYAIDNEKKFLLIATSKQGIFNLIDNITEGK